MVAAWSASAGQVIIEVKEAGSAKPVEGAKVVAISGTNSAAGVTGADGLCKLDATLTSGSRMDVQKEGWCPMRWEISQAQPAREQNRYTFRLQPASTLGGLVADETKAPVAGARIYLNFPQALMGAHIPVEDLAIVTDSSGKWQAGFVPGEVESIHLDLVDPDYEWMESQPALSELRSGKAILTLKTLLGLRGRVLDPSGQPVAGAEVHRGNEWGIMGFGSSEKVKTGADGSFRFPNSQAGTVQVAALASGFGAVLTTVTLTKGMAPVELHLTSPHPRRIRVTDIDGQPIVHMKVTVSEWESFHSPPWEFRTDDEGRINFSNAPAGRLSMDFLDAHHMGLPMRPVAATEDEQVIQLGPPLRLHGKVIDAQTGEPIAAFKVTPGWPQQGFQNGQSTNQGAQWGMSHQSRSFKHSTYDWTFTQHVIVGTERPYDFLIRVEADGYAPAVSRVFKATEKDAEYDFQLSAATYLTGTVRFSDGSPAGGATIYLPENERELFFKNGLIEDNGRNAKKLAADADGHFKWMKQPGVRPIIVWHDKGFASVTAAEFEQSNNNITLTRWSTVEGTLWRGNHVAANETIGLCFNPKYEKQDGRQIMQRNLFFSYESKTDGQGRFVFDKVPPGEAAVARVEPILRPQMFGLELGDVWAGCRLAVVNAPEGGRAQVKAGGNGRTVRGKLVSTNDFSNCDLRLSAVLPGIPYPDGLDGAAKQEWAAKWFWSDAGAKYRIWYGGTPQADIFRQSLRSWQVKVEADGTFQIDDVPPAHYRLNATFQVKGENPWGGTFQQGGESRAPTHTFSIPPGDNLPEMPALDLGTIGEIKPLVEIAVAEPSAKEPVTVAMKTDRPSARPGEVFEITVRARIAEDHHIYAANAANSKTFTPTTLKLTLPDGVETASEWSMPVTTQAADGEYIFTNSVTFHRSLKVRADAAGGPLSINGELKCQACNGQLCWPPKTFPLSTTFTVQPQLKGTP